MAAVLVKRSIQSIDHMARSTDSWVSEPRAKNSDIIIQSYRFMEQLLQVLLYPKRTHDSFLILLLLLITSKAKPDLTAVEN